MMDITRLMFTGAEVFGNQPRRSEPCLRITLSLYVAR